MFTEKDLQLFQKKGISPETVLQQIMAFKKGFPPINITAPATIGNGIIRLTDKEINDFTGFYNAGLESNSVCKFVPASGAASRMFKGLYEFYENTSKNTAYIEKLISSLDHLALIDDLREITPDLNDLIEKKEYKEIVGRILFSHGLNYGHLPKGLIKFHRYNKNTITAFEEHLIEGANHARQRNNIVNIHFTVSPDHYDTFLSLLEMVMVHYEESYKVKYNITFSKQSESTDTIAVDLNNEPFRTEDGTILFRPGGHGTLIKNLNELDEDVIFIKNIDNVSSELYKGIIYRYKKALAGFILNLRQKIYNYIDNLENNRNSELIHEVLDFLSESLFIVHPERIDRFSKSHKIQYCLGKLNRPIRVCGMVRNEGDTGGGPFWVSNKDDTESLQILEASQINFSDKNQLAIFEQSTHFNPVDIVCIIKDRNGNKYNLVDYCDPDTGFIAVKSRNGKELKALELPGLWNGSMANWNTVFVEVPPETFNPVKSVKDLLLKGHQ